LVFVPSWPSETLAAFDRNSDGLATLIVATDENATISGHWWRDGTACPAFSFGASALEPLHRAELASWLIQALRPDQVIDGGGRALRDALARQGTALRQISLIRDGADDSGGSNLNPPATLRQPEVVKAQDAQVHITLVITAHREGAAIEPSLRCAARCVQRARESGLDVEVILTLDRADSETREHVHRLAAPDWTIVSIDVGDVAIARNHATSLALGRWIAFLDADDLFDSDWLCAAYAAASAESRLTVWHPQINLYFQNNPRLWQQADMDDPAVKIDGLICSDYWTSLCFAPRSLLLAVPYSPNDFERGIGYEDWAWIRDVIAHGAHHKVVPGTVHFIRVKNSNSVHLEANRYHCMQAPTHYFRQRLIERTTNLSATDNKKRAP
jgi:hypothetical protein